MSVNGELLVIAISIVALAAAGILSSSAHAEEDCLAAPSGRPPPGSHGTIALTTSNSASAGIYERKAKRAKRVLPPQHGQERNVHRTHPLI
jgi:hypothetical protein